MSDKRSARINCGIDFRPGHGFGAYSAMIRVAGNQLSPIAGTVDEDATFIRCAMMAAAEGLEALPSDDLKVDVVTPSTYLCESFGDYQSLQNQREAGWVDENGDATVHSDLWDRILDSSGRQESVNFILASDVDQLSNTRHRRDLNGLGEREKRSEDAGIAEDGNDRGVDCEISYNVATVGNPGIGAYVIMLDFNDRRHEFSGKFESTSYGRMHLTACIDALDAVRREFPKDGLHMVLNTPDEFTANAMHRGWVDEWRRNGWQRREGERVRNADLWQIFSRRISRHDFELRLVMDTAASDALARRAQAIAKREKLKIEESADFKRREDEDVANGHAVRLYAAGSMIDSPGPGGWSVLMDYKGRSRTRSEGYMRTSNNRMELMGPATVLMELADLASSGKLDAGTKVILISDSQNLVSAMLKGWAKKWRKNSWTKQNGDKVENVDLWKSILRANDRLKSLEFRWSPPHSGNKGNERCAKLAMAAARQPAEKLVMDGGYVDKDG